MGRPKYSQLNLTNVKIKFGILQTDKIAYIKLGKSIIKIFYLYLFSETHIIILCCLSRTSEISNESRKGKRKTIRKTLVFQVEMANTRAVY